MRPKTQVIHSKKWYARSFQLKAPIRTNSAEILKADTVVTTTGELTKSRWFVCVTYPAVHRHGLMRLEAWVRRKDLLNPLMAEPMTEEMIKKMRMQRIKDALHRIVPR